MAMHVIRSSLSNSKRFATPADPLLPMDVGMFGNIDIKLLEGSPPSERTSWEELATQTLFVLSTFGGAETQIVCASRPPPRPTEDLRRAGTRCGRRKAEPRTLSDAVTNHSLRIWKKSCWKACILKARGHPEGVFELPA